MVVCVSEVRLELVVSVRLPVSVADVVTAGAAVVVEPAGAAFVVVTAGALVVVATTGAAVVVARPAWPVVVALLATVVEVAGTATVAVVGSSPLLPAVSTVIGSPQGSLTTIATFERGGITPTPTPSTNSPCQSVSVYVITWHIARR